MTLLRLLSWNYARRHGLRSLLTAAGIALGVAVFLAVHTVNSSILEAFSETVDRIAGQTELQVMAGEAGVAESVLADVQEVACVGAAAPVIETAVRAQGRDEGSVLILGVDMTGDRSLREYSLDEADDAVIEDPLIFLALPDSLMVSREFADRNGLELGDEIELDTVLGLKAFTVRGIMQPGGLAGAYGGNLAVMDIYAAQFMLGRGRMFDRIDVATTEAASIDDCRRELEGQLGAGFTVEPPAARSQHFAGMMRSLTLSVGFVSAFALLIGVFIIYNSFSIAVSQRRREIGVLRSLGATMGQIRGLFLGESVVLGLIGSVAGAAAGLGAAYVSSGFVSAMLTDLYGSAQNVETASPPWLVAVAIAIGVLASVAGCYLPAREAALVDPVEALRKGSHERLTHRENRARNVAAVLLVGAAAACLWLVEGLAGFYGSYALAVLAAILLGPALSLMLARALRPVLASVFPVEGALAADSLIHAPRRTSATVSALMLSLALAVGFAGVALTSYQSIIDWVDATLSPDLFVSANDSINKRAFAFPASLGPRLDEIPGVAEYQGVRMPRVPFRDGFVMLVAIDIEKLGGHVSPDAVEGDHAEMFRLAAEGRGAIISDNLAYSRDGLRLGDQIELQSPAGPLQLPVVGIMVDYSDQEGTILLDRQIYAKRWGDDTVNLFRVYLEDGFEPNDVRGAILEAFSDERQVFVMTNREIRSYVTGLAEQWFGLTYSQLAIAVLVALLGIVNTLTVSIIDRRRELGVLQAVGAVRSQIRRTVWLEAVAIGVVGLILGLALGAINLCFMVEMMQQDVAGHQFAYTYPVQTALMLIPAILATSFLSALGPAESALRGAVVEALQDE